MGFFRRIKKSQMITTAYSTLFTVAKFAWATLIGGSFLFFGIILSGYYWLSLYWFWAALFLFYGTVIVLRLNISPFRGMSLSDVLKHYFFCTKRPNQRRKNNAGSYYRAGVLFSFLLPVIGFAFATFLFSAGPEMKGVFAAMLILNLIGLFFLVRGFIANVACR